MTVSDDGGSSGRLRKELNVPPPGDIRNCIVALSEKEALLSRLFQYRFKAGEGLEGHSFGNLFLSAMTDITGDFSEAVKHAAAILATRGHIYPATTSNAQLYAIMDDGSVVRGETNITASQRRIVELRMAPMNARPAQAALEAIENADLITIGPGSLFTSLVPNLLVRDLSKAIKNSRAIKVYVCNLMTQANESLDLTASQHIDAIYKHARHEFFDYALVNQTPASATMAKKYAEKQQSQIVVDAEQDRGAWGETDPRRLPGGGDGSERGPDRPARNPPRGARPAATDDECPRTAYVRPHSTAPEASLDNLLDDDDPEFHLRNSRQSGIEFAIIILAAGKGTRLKSRHPKVLAPDRRAGRCWAMWSPRRTDRSAEHIFAIIGHEAERVREALAVHGNPVRRAT